jgi:hypothetical protein
MVKYSVTSRRRQVAKGNRLTSGTPGTNAPLWIGLLVAWLGDLGSTSRQGSTLDATGAPAARVAGPCQCQRFRHQSGRASAALQIAFEAQLLVGPDDRASAEAAWARPRPAAPSRRPTRPGRLARQDRQGARKILRRWFELMMANQEDLAVLMTAEQGKPLAEARARSPTPLPSSSGSPRKASASTAT